jgi:4-hydroxy-3-polyprenylbenzoate decarboxylase
VLEAVRRSDRRIAGMRFVHDALLLVGVRGAGMPLLRRLVAREELSSVAIIAAVSEDVDLEDRENSLWGLFTRFDCERDVIFTEQRMIGISPVYRGCMGIDATWRRGYPAPLVMEESVVRKVDQRWDSYWK